MSLRLPSLAGLVAAIALAAGAPSASAGEVRGRVVIEGKPAAGAAVSLLPFEDGFAAARREARREPPPPAVVSGTTRPDGTFALPVPAAGAPEALTLAVSGAGLPPYRLVPIIDAEGKDLGDIRLGRPAALAGRVVDANGGPVVGATVTLWAGRGRSMDDLAPAAARAQTATTTADGGFRFDAAGSEGNRLRFEAPGFATLERAQVRSGALARPAVLALGRLVRGKVTLSDKRTPAAAALARFEGRVSTRWCEVKADGSFLIDGAPAEAGTVVVDAGPQGRAAASVAASVAEPVSIVLAPTAVLRGRVVDADSARPIAGVRLLARGEGSVFLARSRADGSYEIRGLAPQRYRLQADDERFVPWLRSVPVIAGQTEEQDVPLVRGATLAGRVLDENGTPVDGAVLSLVRSGEPSIQAFMRRMDGEVTPIRSGRDGSFKASRLVPGENQRLDVRHDEFEERSLGGIDLAAGATRSGLSVVLRRGLSLRGLVRDEEGRPLSGVEVTLSRPTTFRGGGRYGQASFSFMGPGGTPRRETGADGRFEFRGLKAGDYTLAATRIGLQRVSVDPVKVAEDRAPEPVEITLRPGVTISGFVRDRGGQPAAGWYLAARPSGDGSPMIGPGGLRTLEATGTDGAFVLEGLSDGGSYDLQLMGPSGLGPRRAGVTAPAEGLELTVGGHGELRGRVVDAEGGRPITDFEVSFAPDAQGGMRVVFAGPGSRGRGPGQAQPVHAEDGSFLLEEVPAGRWTITASAPGYQKGSAAGITLEEGGSIEGVELRLTRGAAISGRVLEARGGRPVLDASVRASLAGARGAMSLPMVRMGGGLLENEVMTDAEGRYELAGLAPGAWTLTATHADWTDTTVSVEVKDAPVVADIRLGRGGSIGGVVTAAGRPVPGAQVALTAAGQGVSMGPLGGNEQGSLTDEAGRFRFDRVAPGRYSLGASLRNQASAPAEVVITGEEAREVALSLGEGAVIRGAVSGLAENARANVTVSASGPEQFFATTRTGPDGRFELVGVPEGPIHLNARAGDFLSSSRMANATVAIAPGQTEAAVEIVFEAGFRVDGHVTRAGRPVPEVMVFAAPTSGGGRNSAVAQTDEAGAFALEGLQEGEYSINVSASRPTAPITRRVAISGDTTVDLELPAARIAGVVLEAGSARPLGDVALQIDDEGAGGMRFMSGAASDSSGRFAFEDLEPKEYRLSFQKPAYQSESRRAVASEGGPELRVELRRGAGVEMQARDGVFGTPLRGLMVRAIDAAGQTAFTGSVPLDSEGRGEVPGLRPGSYELRVDSSGYAPARLPGVTVPSPLLAVALTPGGSLEIRVGPQTLALPRPEATLLAADGRACLWSIFADDGRLRFREPLRRIENVPPGRYTLRIEGGEAHELVITEGGQTAVSLP